MANKFVTLEGRENWRMAVEVPPRELGGDQVEINLERVIPALLGQVSPILRKTDYFIQLTPHIIRENLDYKQMLSFGGGEILSWAKQVDGEIVEVSKAHLAISAATLRSAKDQQASPELTFLGLIFHEIFELDNLIVDGIKTVTPVGHPRYSMDPSEIFATSREMRLLSQQFGGTYCIKDACIVYKSSTYATFLLSSQSISKG